MNASGRPFAPGLGRAGLRAVVLALVACVAPVRGASSAADSGGRGRRAQGAALRDADRRDRLRPGADLRPLFEHARGAHVRCAATSTNFWPGRCASGRARRPACPRRRTTSGRSSCGFGPASISSTTRRSRASDASSSPRTTSTRSSAISTRAGRARAPPTSRTSSCSAWPSCARPRSRAASRSTTTARSRACARSTATRCSSSSAKPNPRFAGELTTSSVTGAVAREVVEFYGDRIMEHPVGTGPFRLAEWRRSSKIVFEKNPELPRRVLQRGGARRRPAGAGRRRAGSRAGKLPMVDRVEVSVIEENQPRWLSFVNARDGRDRAGAGRLHLHRDPEQPGRAQPRQARHLRGPLPAQRRLDVVLRDGEPGRSAATRPRRSRCAARSRWRSTSTRRSASCGAARRSRRSRSWRRGVSGYDPAFRSEMSEFRPRHARRRCSTSYGYVDRDGDGWREQPDGLPLTLEYATQPDDLSRQLITQWKKNMDAVGLRIVFRIAQVAREPEGIARGQADDVGRGLERRPGRRGLPDPRPRPGQGPGQPCPLPDRRVRPPVRAAAAAARRPRALCR